MNLINVNYICSDCKVRYNAHEDLDAEDFIPDYWIDNCPHCKKEISSFDFSDVLEELAEEKY